MSNRRRRRKVLPEPLVCKVESLTTEGRGLVHIDDRPVFIDGALLDETVRIEFTSSSKKYAQAKVIEVIQASDDRTDPPCQHASLCGGCSLQHMKSEQQIIFKQQAMLDALSYTGHVQPGEVLSPLTGPVTGYRQKARLGVRFVAKKDRVLVGFREKQSGYLAILDQCEVLNPRVGHQIDALSKLIYSLDGRDQIPQIEVAAGDDDIALVFRHLEPLTDADRAKLIDYARQQNFVLMLQPGGHETVHQVWPAEPTTLSYSLPDQGLIFTFESNDFTQVNPAINRQMINRALSLLELKKTDRVLDLFCGMGNFTLPMAQQADHVVGVEGSQELVKKAQSNAMRNKISNVEFHAVDLSQPLEGFSWLNKTYDKILLDPPRSGAMEMMHYLGKLNAKRIVYVSCNPVTLARDAGKLVNEHGYTLLAAGVMDMFPHTAHVESIAVFEK